VGVGINGFMKKYPLLFLFVLCAHPTFAGTCLFKLRGFKNIEAAHAHLPAPIQRAMIQTFDALEADGLSAENQQLLETLSLPNTPGTQQHLRFKLTDLDIADEIIRNEAPDQKHGMSLDTFFEFSDFNYSDIKLLTMSLLYFHSTRPEVRLYAANEFMRIQKLKSKSTEHPIINWAFNFFATEIQLSIFSHIDELLNSAAMLRELNQFLRGLDSVLSQRDLSPLEIQIIEDYFFETQNKLMLMGEALQEGKNPPMAMPNTDTVGSVANTDIEDAALLALKKALPQIAWQWRQDDNRHASTYAAAVAEFNLLLQKLNKIQAPNAQFLYFKIQLLSKPESEGFKLFFSKKSLFLSEIFRKNMSTQPRAELESWEWTLAIDYLVNVSNIKEALSLAADCSRYFISESAFKFLTLFSKRTLKSFKLENYAISEAAISFLLEMAPHELQQIHEELARSRDSNAIVLGLIESSVRR